MEVIISGNAGAAGLEFQLGGDFFYFSTKLESGELKFGLSDSSFADADAKATSTRAWLKVGMLNVIVDNFGNSASIDISSSYFA
jgi:hypothetical protein